jgi:hypothetical protein
MKKEIIKRTITREIVEYIGECDICGKKIRGSTEGQVSFNLLVHKQSKECNKNEH